jgi:UDP-N-acetylglucosamine--N-acetylmuramyl-(pentapeptide) pyrophosphoryl-undecaprenol N-acetylglucosamine transferase
MILAGGTGGHIFPGLAGRACAARARHRRVLARRRRRHGNAPGAAARRGHRHHRGEGPARQGHRDAARRAVARAQRDRAAARVVKQRNPRAIISFGGYAAGPGGVAAKLAGLPLLVHEQNRAPGFTNRVLARVAQRVLTGFPDTFRNKVEEVVGNPVRGQIAAIAPPQFRMADAGDRFRLLVLGGSQGARALNLAVPQALQALGDAGIEVRHQCGEKLRADAEAAYAQAGIAASVEPFIADMAAAYAWADLVVCRAGALTLAELCAAGVGSVLVPFPQAVDDHQTRNAEFLVERSAAVLLPQNDALAGQLTDVLRDLRADPARRLAMAEAARGLARPDAAARVADIVIEEIRRHDGTLQEAA